MHDPEWDKKAELAQSPEGRIELTLDNLNGACPFWDLAKLRQGAEEAQDPVNNFHVGTFKYFAKAMFSVAKAHQKGMLSEEEVEKFAAALDRARPYESFFESRGVCLRYLDIPSVTELRSGHDHSPERTA